MRTARASAPRRRREAASRSCRSRRRRGRARTEVPRVAALEIGDDGPDGHRGIDLRQARGRGFGLRRDPRGILGVEEKLAGQVRRLDDVAIHEGQTSEAGPDRRLGRGRADGADARRTRSRRPRCASGRRRRSRGRGSTGSTSRAPGSSGGLQQRARVLERRLRDLLAGEHARDLLDAFGAFEKPDGGHRPAADLPLLGQKLAIRRAPRSAERG